MKQYQWQRKELKERLNTKRGLNRKTELMQATRKLAIETWKFSDDRDTEWEQWETFCRKLRRSVTGHLNAEIVDTYFIMYKRCCYTLHEKAVKASFLNKHYKPLESDLFEI